MRRGQRSEWAPPAQVAHPGVAADFFREHDAFVVVIERREKLLQLVSTLQSSHEGMYHVHHVNASRPPSSPQRVAPERAMSWIGKKHEELAAMRAWAATWASGARGVFYEDLVADPRKGSAPRGTHGLGAAAPSPRRVSDRNDRSSFVPRPDAGVAGLAEIFREMGLDPSAPLLEGNHGMENFHKVHEGTCAGRISNAADLVAAHDPAGELPCACSGLF